MQRAESDNTVSQIVNWYLTQAEQGGHRADGQPDDPSELKIQWSMFTRYMSKEFRSRPFKDLGAVDMQAVIDDADPPPLKWSALKYGFESLKEDGHGKTTQARRDRREAAAG